MRQLEKGPTCCPTCHGTAPSFCFLEKFVETDYGHCWCRRCGITFDSNVNDIPDLAAVSEGSLRELDEPDFRARFVETSRISSEAGVIYPKFDFDDNDQLQRGISESAIRSISEHIDVETSFKLLDLGCGNGFTTKVLSDHFRSADVLGLDPSPQVAMFAEKLGFHGVQGTLQTMNFPAGEFDAAAVIGNLMLHPDPFATLLELKRVLRTGGVLVFDVRNIRSLSRVVARNVLRFGGARLGGRAVHYLERNFINMRFGFTKKVVRGYLEELGFENISIFSKPPRLLEFSNKSGYQRGMKGWIWRVLNWIDARRDQQAWLHFSCTKTADSV